jgi:hypothetical protein
MGENEEKWPLEEPKLLRETLLKLILHRRDKGGCISVSQGREKWLYFIMPFPCLYKTVLRPATKYLYRPEARSPGGTRKAIINPHNNNR